MKEPIELIEERIIEIRNCIESMGPDYDDVLQLNEITELYNRYVAAHLLIGSNTIGIVKRFRFVNNQNHKLLKKIEHQQETIKNNRKLRKKYYDKSISLQKKLKTSKKLRAKYYTKCLRLKKELKLITK